MLMYCIILYNYRHEPSQEALWEISVKAIKEYLSADVLEKYGSAQLQTTTASSEPAEQQTEPVGQQTEPAEQQTEPAEQQTEPADQQTEPAEQQTEPAEQQTGEESKTS